jgi:Sulfatase
MALTDRVPRTSLRRIPAALALLVGMSAVSAAPGARQAVLGAGNVSAAYAAGGCALGANGAIKHVIYFQFDNTHFMRDLANVPSDLEQMPHLSSFIQSNGVILTNHHTPLISHTSEDILTSLTGVYPNRHGVAVGQNSYQYYQNGSPTSFTSAFTYWTDTIGNGTYNMLSGAPTAAKPTGTNAPAPWVPYTRAGCDVGAVASANLVLENANVNSKFGANDIGNVYGVSSPEAQETTAQRTADFVGVAVHCSQADSASGLCSSTNHGRPEVLPDEPAGYTGFNGLFGHKYVAPQIGGSGTTALNDINGKPIVNTSTNAPGFPGFDGMNAAVSLGYVADMQEHGVPVTYAYISDAHDQNPAATHTALGPGEQAYEQQLKAYDTAFGSFFTRLANDGINQSNTLFVFTSDEGDHFAGGPPTTPGCTGATIDSSQNPPVVTPGNYCSYSKTATTTPPGPPFGEVAVGLDGLLSQQQGLNNYTFTVGNDTAPTIYLNGQPARADASARTFERATGALTVTNPLSNATEPLAQYLADPVEMNLLHMVTADPTRTPTFTMFARPDYYVTGTCSGGFNSIPPPVYAPKCVLQEPAFAWLHGNVQPDISTTWLGLVGPGVQNKGIDNTTWSDHTDIRPTMLALLGLKDDYSHDGRTLVEDLGPSALPASLTLHRGTLVRLGQMYKQINAPVAGLGLATLAISTNALQSSSAGDATYTQLESQLQSLGTQRDALASQMIAALEGAEFNGQPIDEQAAQSLIAQGQALLDSVNTLAGPSAQGFLLTFLSSQPGQGEVFFGTGPGCAGLVSVATEDQSPGTTRHAIFVTGNDLPGTVGSNGISPGTTYWYETVTTTAGGTEINNNAGNCYPVTAG